MADLIDRMAETADQLADAAEAGAKLANNPDALRARLAELETEQASDARSRLRELIAQDEAGFNRRFEEGDPVLFSLIEQSQV
jgi:cell division protein FtsB